MQEYSALGCKGQEQIAVHHYRSAIFVPSSPFLQLLHHFLPKITSPTGQPTSAKPGERPRRTFAEQSSRQGSRRAVCAQGCALPPPVGLAAWELLAAPKGAQPPRALHSTQLPSGTCLHSAWAQPGWFAQELPCLSSRPGCIEMGHIVLASILAKWEFCSSLFLNTHCTRVK